MSTTLTSPYITVTAADIKENSQMVINMIQKRLNVGCKVSNALDIAATAVGVNDYATFKGLADKKHYTLQANMGTRAEPFYIERNVGFFDNASLASLEADSVLENCEKVIEWHLLENGKQTHVKKHTAPKSNGLFAQIEVFGDTLSDLSYGIEEAASQISSGCTSGSNSNDEGEYFFEVSGDEASCPVRDLLDTPFMAIIDDDGFMMCTMENTAISPQVGYTSGHNDTINEFQMAGENGASIQEWFGDLVLIERTRLEDEDDEQEILALDSEGMVVHHLPKEELEEILNSDKSQEPVFLFTMAKVKR